MRKRFLIILFTFLLLFLLPSITTFAFVIYEVKPGDSLNKVSSQYKLNVKNFAQLNGLEKNDKLVIGQAMIIPGSTYYVKGNESLWDISYRHSISVQLLKSKNKLTNDNISPGQKLFIPSTSKKKIWTGTYFILKNKKTDNWMLDHYKKTLTSIFIFEYHSTKQGNLIKVKENGAIKQAWKKGITPYATFTNISEKGFDPNLLHNLISNKTLRKKLISNIYTLLDRNDLKGINLDLEMVKPNDRVYLNQFIKELSVKLHRSKMELLIAMPPKEADNIPSYYYAYDYKTFGKYVDKMFIMAYNWHWSSSPSGPIAPIQNVRKSLQYATSVVPKSKILLGIPQYAYDWPITGDIRTGSAISTQNAINIYKKYKSQVYYDQDASAPAFRYIDNKGTQHEVWFEDPRSLLAKFQLVKNFNLAGLGCWHIGITMPQTEEILLNEFWIR
ncbi:glycoside hydrolase [Gottfriedia luciferensis]|uniref:Glycoside hydrolase n=1 Tax=Gottfriedia luciferensis TaxID=178774 RepID=A0ABX2ZW34_9BACI|nr:glycosyl hydrolase family 18 protein [Gottfriedia luciferensis]ODG92639.1 glycoside hydrolase [Gottfriedia luciferensis]